MSSSTGINPFPGIRPFDIQEKYLFFGREDQTAELLTRLRKTRFLAVVGSSGSGKSSLVRAGLIPELHGGTMAAAGSSWEVAVMKPGGDPLTNLAKSLVESDLYDPDQEDVLPMIRAALSRSGMGLVDAVQQSDLEPKTNLLLVVDQFEEIFRFRRMTGISEEEAGHFIRLLLEASQQETCPIYVVLTMRSDFLGDCAQFGGLAEAVNEGEYIIPRLNRSQRKQAIEAPARVGGREMSNRLVQRLLNDISDDPDQLPILQHALMRTWDYWVEAGSEGPVDLEHYQATGGMAEALSRHADEVFESLPDEEHRRIATKLFKSLTEKVSENRGIRRPMQLNELHEICGGEMDHLLHVIHEFRKTGCTFLMPAGESELQKHTIIDISHESLMRVWRTLRLWVDDEAQSAKIYRRLADTASLFKDGKAGLYRDPDLGIALAWRDANQPNQTWADRYYPGFAEAMAFLDKSQAEEEREAKEREEARKRELAQAQALAKAKARTARIFKAACVGVTLLAVLALYSMFEAQKSRDIAEKSIAEQAMRSELASLAAEETGQPGIASAWMMDAIQLTAQDSDQYDKRLSGIKRQLSKAPKTIRHLNTGKRISAAFATKKNIITLGEDSNLSRYDLTLEIASQTKSEISASDLKLANSHNHHAVWLEGDSIHIYDLMENRTLFRQPIENDYLNTFEPIEINSINSNLVYAIRGETDKLIILDYNNGNSRTITLDDPLNEYHITDSGSVLFTTLKGHQLKLYQSSQTVEKELIADYQTTKLSCLLSSSGNQYYLITRDKNKNHQLWTGTPDVKSTKKMVTESPNRIESYEISSSNKKAILKHKGGNCVIVDIGSSNSEMTLENQTNSTIAVLNTEPIEQVKISPNSAYVITVETNATVNLYDINTGRRAFGTIAIGQTVKNITWNNTNNSIIIVGGSGELKEVALPLFTTQHAGFFQSPFETINAKINNQDAYSSYKLIFPQVLRDVAPSVNPGAGGLNGLQIAEIALLDKSGDRITNSESLYTSSDLRTANGQTASPTGEEAEKAFDGLISSKYFNFVKNKQSALQVDLSEPRVVTQVSFTSANDAIGRAPISYVLQGSRDGANFQTIQEGFIENPLYSMEQAWLSNNLNTAEQISMIAPTLSGYIISNNGKPTPYEYKNDIQLQTLEDANDEVKLGRAELLARRNYQNGQFSSALYYFDQIPHEHYTEKPSPEKAQLLRLHANSLASLGYFDAATPLLAKASDISPYDWEILSELCTCYLATFQYDLFNKTFAKLIESSIIGQNTIFWNFQYPRFVRLTDLDLEAESIKKLKTQITIGHNAQHLLTSDNELDLSLVFENLEKGKSSLASLNNTGESYIELERKPFDFSKGLSIEAWVKRGTKWGWIFNLGGEGFQLNVNDGFSLIQTQNDGFRFEMANKTMFEKLFHDFKTIGDGWIHLACTWNAKTAEVSSYINGTKVTDYSNMTFENSANPASIFEGPIALPAARQPMSGISTIFSPADGGWDGAITELRIWDYALDEATISKNYQVRITEKRPGLIGYWPLSENNLNHPHADQMTYHFPKWSETSELPDSIGDKGFAQLGKLGTADSSFSFNRSFLEDWAYIKIVEGEYDTALNLLSVVKFGKPDGSLITKTKDFDIYNLSQSLKISLALRKKGLHMKSEEFLQHARNLTPNTSLDFQHPATIFGLRLIDLLSDQTN